MQTRKQHKRLRAGWLIDGAGARARKDMMLEIADGKIARIAEASIENQNRKDVLDLSGCTVMPGLIDGHVHLFMSGTDDMTVREKQLSAGYDDLRDVMADHVRRHLACGVAAVRDGGDFAAHALRFKMEMAGDDAVPVRIKAAGRAWRAPGRYGRLIGRPPSKGLSLAQAILADGEPKDHVKIANSGINSLKAFGKETPPQFEPEELSGAVSAARRLGLKTMVHANGRRPVAVAVQAGCHSVEHGFFMGTENLQRMADKQIYWVPTAFTMKACARHLKETKQDWEVAQKNADHQMAQIAEARRRGVPVALGTDAGSIGVHHGDAVAEELRIFMDAGFSVEQAVQCATSNGADLLGLENMGRIAVGASATFIAVPGAPSVLPESLRRIAYFFIDGDMQAGGSRVTQARNRS